MAKKFQRGTLHIRLLNPEGEKKINELIKLGLIKIDDEYIRLELERQELTQRLAKSHEQLEHYLRQKLLE